MLLFIIGLLSSYLLGSVPFGLLIGFAKKIDVRKFGSKNIGATNVARVLGSFKWFMLVFVLDFTKGLLPTLLFSFLFIEFSDSNNECFFIENSEYLRTFFGLSAILGHVFPIYLLFKGGKGVATGAGVVAALTPLSFIISFGVFLLIFFIYRFVSLGSIFASIALVASEMILAGSDAFDKMLPVTCFYIFICILIIFKHRINIRRLIKGEEAKIKR